MDGRMEKKRERRRSVKANKTRPQQSRNPLKRFR
jgi:hypothetical protein